MPRNVPSLDPLRVQADSSSGERMIKPRMKKIIAVTTATTKMWASCETASTKITLSRSARLKACVPDGSGIAENGVSASCATWPATADQVHR